ncbi:MAG: hypothetical protein WBB25_01930 [Sulfitobacter sp.]
MKSLALLQSLFRATPVLVSGVVAVLIGAQIFGQAYAESAQDTAGITAGQNDYELTLPQARQLAISALRTGRPKLAYQLSDGLLQADPKSSFAHFTKATAQGQLGLPRDALRSAAKAYRFADTRLHKFEAAELAARLSYVDARPTLTQLWLRRAVQNAPNAQIEQQLARDFGVVRARNPLSFSIRGGLRPSNNVNSGADSAEQIIDGLPFTGVLSGSAQALSGLAGTLDVQLGYRLRGDKRSRTDVGARLYLRRVALTSGSRIQAPDVTNGDFGSTYLEANVTHGFALGDSRNSATLGAAVGQLWSGRNKSYGFARLEANRDWHLGKATRLTLDGSVEQRQSNQAAILDSTTLGLVSGLQHRIANGDTISAALTLRHTDSDYVNTRNTSATMSGTYAFAQQIGPAKVSVSIAAGYSEYPDFVALFVVPGGRQDKSVYANLNLFFPDMDYAGFAPSINISAGRKFSNVSRYETRELSVSMGIQSKF